MAKVYPISVDNNVNIKEGKNTIGKQKQNVRMLARSKNLFDFTVKGEKGRTSLMNVYEKEGKSYVKINALEKFLGNNKEALSANPELAKIFSENGLQIGSNAINVSQTGEEITITINSEDGKPYVITAGPTSISLDYGTGKDATHYSCQPEGENCVDITISKKTVERMLSSEEGNGLFSPTDNIRKVPTTFVGMYMKGMAPNSSVQLGEFTLTSCAFSKDGAPYCFVKQPKSKTADDTLFFTNGRFVTCKGLLRQYDPITNTNNIVIETGTKNNPKYFALPIETDENGKVSPDFIQGYEKMTDLGNTTFESRPIFDKNGKIVHALKEKADGSYVINKRMFEDKDNRQYTSHSFTIKPKTYEMFGVSPQITNDDEIESGVGGNGGIISTNNEQQNSGDDRNGIVANDSSSPEQDGQAPDSDVNSGNDGGAGSDGNNPPQDEQSPSQDGQTPQQDSPQQAPPVQEQPAQDGQTPERDDGSDSGDDNGGGENGGDPQGPADDGGNGTNPQGPRVTPQAPVAPPQNPSDDDNEIDEEENGEGNLGSTPQAQPSPPTRTHVNPYIARYNDLNSEESKAKLKAKNDRFRAGLQTFNTVCGDTLSYVGAFMMLVSLIPGIGLATLIPGLIIGFVGLFQSTFADRLVFSPFRKLHRRLKHYEQEEAEEFDYRDQFIENEKELQSYAEQSQEKVNRLEKMYNAPENGGNEFAHDFARVYNSNGVGFVRDSERPGVSQLSDLSNLNNRIAMTNMLDQIAKTKSPNTRQALVETFTNSYFQDLTTEQRQSISSDLFNPAKNDQLVAYVGALNETNTEQIKEKALEDTQREAISTADSYRLISLASSKELTEEQRIEMFKRYGTDIVTNNLLKQNGSSEALNDILEAVPEESRAQVAQILNDSAQKIQSSVGNVSNVARDNAERQATVDKLQSFADALISLDKDEQEFITINECDSSVQEFMIAYTLNYNSDNKANTIRENFNNQYLNDNNHLDATFTNERALNSTVNNFVANLNSDSSDVKALVEHQKAVYDAIEQGGFYKEISSYYTSGVASEGAILPNLNKKEKVYSHTTEAVVGKIAKERFIDMLCEETGDKRLRSKLHGKNVHDIINDYGIKLARSGNPAQPTLSYSYKGQRYSTTKEEHINNITPVMNVYKAIDNYNQSRNAVVAKLVTDEFVAEANTDVNNNGVSIASYDSNLKTYTRVNYNDLTKPITQSEEEVFAKFSKTYPDFNNFSDEVKRKIVLSKLGLDGQRERIEKERADYLDTKKQEEENIDKQIAKGGPQTEALKLQKANLAKERANQEAEFSLLLSVYTKADSALTGIIDGKFNKAYTELAVVGALDPNGTVAHSQDDVYKKGQKVKENVKKYNSFRETVSSLPIPEKDKAHIIATVNNRQHDGTIKDFLLTSLAEHIQAHTVDGQSGTEILSSLLDQNDELKMSKVKKYCAEKRKQLDSRSQLNLTAPKHMLGDEFVSTKFKQGVKDAKKGVKQYGDYIDFFTENGKYNEQTHSSVLYPGMQFASKEEFEEQIASDFAMAKTKRAQNKLISRYVSAMGCEKEYKKAKKHITNKEKPSKDNQQYHSLADKMKKMYNAYEKYDLACDGLLHSDLSDSSNILDKLTKEECKTLGISYKAINKILGNEKLSSDEKKGKLRTLMAKNEHSIMVDALTLSDQVLVADSARAGTTEADRQIARARAKYTVEQKALKEFEAKSKAIEEFMESNPNYPYTQDLLNAYATGNDEFFTTHPEFDTKGLDFGSRDAYILKTLGINLSKVKGKTKEYDLLGKSSKKQQKINSEIKKKNTGLLETFKETAKKELESATERSEKQYYKKAENINQEVRSEEQRTHLDKHTSPSLLTSLKTLVRGNRVRENLGSELEEQNQTVREREKAKKKKKEAEQSTPQNQNEELEGAQG